MDVIAFVFGILGTTFGLVAMAFAMSGQLSLTDEPIGNRIFSPSPRAPALG